MITRSFVIALISIMTASCGYVAKLSRHGGTEFTVQISTAEADLAGIVSKTEKIIENKANAIGLDVEVSSVPEFSDRLKVKYYGNQPLEPIRETLLTVYRLELKKVANAVGIARPYSSKETAQADLKEGQEILPVKKVLDSEPEAYLIVEKQAVINGEDVRNAAVIERWKDNFAVQFTLKPSAAVKFGDWTGRNIHSFLAIIINDEIQSYPIINGQIFDTGQIEGAFTKKAADDIVVSLNAGYLPATMTIIDEKQFDN